MRSDRPTDRSWRRESKLRNAAIVEAAERPALSVVAPCYNEQETLQAFVERAVAACKSAAPTWEVLHALTFHPDFDTTAGRLDVLK